MLNPGLVFWVGIGFAPPWPLQKQGEELGGSPTHGVQWPERLSNTHHKHQTSQMQVIREARCSLGSPERPGLCFDPDLVFLVCGRMSFFSGQGNKPHCNQSRSGIGVTVVHGKRCRTLERTYLVLRPTLMLWTSPLIYSLMETAQGQKEIKLTKMLLMHSWWWKIPQWECPFRSSWYLILHSWESRGEEEV